MNDRPTHPGKLVVLKPVGELKGDEARVLVSILNEDAALKEWLYHGDTPTVTLDEFKRVGQDWQEKHDAVTYCIFAPGPVGQISLTRIHDQKACIGYWLASKDWSKGIATEAFRQVLLMAKVFGIREVSASIEADNRASLRLWEKFGAEQEITESQHIRVRIDIKQ